MALSLTANVVSEGMYKNKGFTDYLTQDTDGY